MHYLCALANKQGSNMNLSNHLYVFNHITANGELRNGKYYFDKLTAWHEIDGYTCYLGYQDLTMSLLFHSRFFYDYEKETTLKEFNLLIENLFSTLKADKC
jgi:hypothetical protein